MRATLKEIFVGEIGLNPDDFTDDLAYNSVPEWDSASHMIIVLAIEEEFNIALESDDVVGMTTIKKICRILEDKGVAVD